MCGLALEAQRNRNDNPPPGMPDTTGALRDDYIGRLTCGTSQVWG